MNWRHWLCLLFASAALPSCGQPGDASADRPVADRPSGAVGSPASWLGKWTGPEGTYLVIAADGDRYSITIRNLDGERTFSGIAGADSLGFERDGVRQTIRATDGEATGMKWLASKSSCLTVRPGEGYCRE